MRPVNIRFCGFGGQGIVLSAIIMGTAAVTRRNLYAVQTQSYGSEARGGQCQAELIISSQPINSPISERKDIIVALSQMALDRYLPSLREGGTLIYDTKLETNLHATSAATIPVPATETAISLGNQIAANMVVLGFLQESTQLITREDLVQVVRETVPAKFLELNLKAVEAGRQLAQGVKLEV
ncbi:MAG: ketoisovalerate oxidoreductase [Firmicutes bacterium]|nr:ketoisovalerate oxidoreductase [Bacillota bacterium]